MNIKMHKLVISNNCEISKSLFNVEIYAIVISRSPERDLTSLVSV